MRRDEEYRGDPLWQLIEQCISLLESGPAVSDQARDTYERLLFTLRIMLGYRDTPSLMVTPSMISSAQGQMGNVKSYFDAWISTQQSSNLDYAQSQLFAVIEAFRGWPNAKSDQLNRAAATLRESIRATDSNIERMQAHFDETLAAFQARWEKREQDLVAQITTLQQTQRQLSASVNQTDSQLSSLDSNIRSKLTEWQTAYLDDREDRASTFQEDRDAGTVKVANLLDTSNTRLMTLLDKQKQSASDTLTELEKMKGQTGEVVSYIANAATSEYFGTVAADEKRNADLLRYGALGSYLGAFVTGVVWIIVSANRDSQQDTWHTMFLKWTVTLSLVGVAVYMTTESGNHRKRQQGPS